MWLSLHRNYKDSNIGFAGSVVLTLTILFLSPALSSNQVTAQNWRDVNLCINPGDMLQYKGPGLGIRYPCDWRAVEPDDLAKRGMPVGDYVIGFVSPEGSAPDAFVEGVQIYAEKLSTLNTPIQELVREKTNSLQQSYSNKNFELIESTPITISGDHPAQALVYTYSEPSLPDTGQAKVMEIITQDGDELFTITYAAQAEDYDTHLQAVQQIVSSLQFVCLDCQLTGKFSFDGSSTSPGVAPPDRIITPDCGIVTDGSRCFD